MIKKDLHIHTTYSDGRDDPESIVLYAIEKGLEEIGFSDHSYTFFDESWCMPKNRIRDYVAEINRLKAKYGDRISVKCGVEQDYYSEESTDCYDYAIGSVHYVYKNGSFLQVDESAEVITDAVKKFFYGDVYAFCEEYFNTVAKFSERDDIKIIGHFDLVAKFNDKGALFDENNERYVKAYKSAAEKLVKSGKTFEINTGAISRGYRTDAYPCKPIREYIKSLGGKFLLSSDAHKKENVRYAFDKFGSETE